MKNPDVPIVAAIVALDKLKPAEWNPRIITDKNFKKLCAKMKEHPQFIWKKPILANKDGTIYAGNMRYRAAEHLKWDGIPAIVSPVKMTLEQMQEEGILDNTHFGEWEDDELAEILFGLDEKGIDIKGLGIDESKVQKYMDDIGIEDLKKGDEGIPELPKDPKSKKGDIYILGQHRVMCGDTTNALDVEKLMDGESASMIFTDPPYNVDYTGKTADALKIDNDNMGAVQYEQFLHDCLMNVHAVTKAGGGLYLCHADSMGLYVRRAFEEAGFLLKQCIIWVKNSIVMGRQDYHWQHEPILYGWKEGTHYFVDDRTQSTVWQIDRPTKSEEHPTMKPIELCAKAIRNSSKQGDIVLDCFLGSGSTLIACEGLKRRCFGMEIDGRYVDVCLERWSKETGKKPVLLKKNAKK